ncbi:MAG: DUF362 domain-containing protein [Candidatus Bathyarchaeia archaeon]
MVCDNPFDVKAGLIGCGRVATTFHLPAMMSIRGLKVGAASDIDEMRLKNAMEKFSIDEGYTDYRLMLRKSNLDAVWVCTPPETHQKIVLDCLEERKHVICEKPLSTSTEGVMEIKNLLEVLNKGFRKVVLMPAHNFLFTPNLELALKMIKDGTIGEVKYVRSRSASNLTFYRAKTDFRLRSGGGVIDDQLPHVIYVSQSVAGRIEKILSVNISRHGHMYINSVRTEALTEMGVKVEMEAEWSEFIPKFEVEINGTSGTIRLDILKSPYRIIIQKDGESNIVDIAKRRLPFLDTLRNKHPSYLREDEHFVKCVRGVEEPKVSVDDELSISRVLEMVTSSLKAEKECLKRDTIALQMVEGDVEESLQNLLRMINVKELKSSSLVLIKPNVCYPKNPHGMVITDPELLRSIINFVKARVNKVLVVESDNNSGRAEARVEKSGLMEVIEYSGAEFVNLSDEESDEVYVSGSTLLIPKIVKEADFLINVPKMKTCNIEGATISIAMKNMFGILSNRKKSILHKNLTDVLLYLNKNVRQDLIIVDGIVAMEGMGPVWGSPVNMNLLVAGTNPVTVDSVCSNIMGISPYSIELLWRAYKEGMGEINIERVDVVGSRVEDFRRNFEIPVITPRSLFKALKSRFTR